MWYLGFLDFSVVVSSDAICSKKLDWHKLNLKLTVCCRSMDRGSILSNDQNVCVNGKRWLVVYTLEEVAYLHAEERLWDTRIEIFTVRYKCS